MSAARINALDAAFGVALDHYVNGRDHQSAVIMLTAVGDLLDELAPGHALGPAHARVDRDWDAIVNVDEPKPLDAAQGMLNGLAITFVAIVVIVLVLAALRIL